MFGRPFRILSDMMYGNFDRSQFHSIDEFQRNMTSMYRCAKRVMGNRQVEMKKQYDKKRVRDPLKVGDLVYVYNPRKKDVKLKPKWNGPFKIVNKSEHVYKVRVVHEAKVVFEWLPRDRLRRCYLPDPVDILYDGNINTINAAEEAEADQFRTSSSSSDDESVIQD